MSGDSGATASNYNKYLYALFLGLRLAFGKLGLNGLGTKMSLSACRSFPHCARGMLFFFYTRLLSGGDLGA